MWDRPLLKDADQICLRCNHLHIKTEDEDKKICRCKTPVLCRATRVFYTPVHKLKRLEEFRQFFEAEDKK